MLSLVHLNTTTPANDYETDDYVDVDDDGGCVADACFCSILFEFFFLSVNIQYHTYRQCVCVYLCMYASHSNPYQSYVRNDG